MKIEVISALESTVWIPIGEGSFNEVAVSNQTINIDGIDMHWVLKTRKNTADRTSHSERAVRKFIEITGLPAYQLSDDQWIAPYLGSVAASDEQTVVAMMEIYLRTRNVIIDGCGKGNFLFYDRSAICIDMDYARRRGSVVSDDPYLWDWPSISKYLETYMNYKPLTTSLIRTLIWLEDSLPPEHIKDSYITPLFFKRLRVVRNAGIIPSMALLDGLFDMPNDYFNELTLYWEHLKEDDCTVNIKKLENVIIEIDTVIRRKQEINAILQGFTWHVLSEDEDHKILACSEEITLLGRTQKWLICIRKETGDLLYGSRRLVCNWNVLQSDNLAYDITDDICVFPNMGYEPVSDRAIAAEVLRIYTETRYLVTNACVPGVFVLNEGRVVCARVDHLRFNDDQDQFFSSLWDRQSIREQLAFWRTHPFAPKPLTSSVLRALCYMEQSLEPTEIKNEYLTLKILEKINYLQSRQVKITPAVMDNIEEVPEEIVSNLFNFLSLADKAALAQTSKRYNGLFHRSLYINKCLNFVAKGDQAAAAGMIASHPALILKVGHLIDRSGRLFKQITPFEYAFWSKDWHMCAMMLHDMDDELMQASVLSLIKKMRKDGLVYEQDGRVLCSTHFDFSPLIEAYTYYLQLLDATKRGMALEEDLRLAWLDIGLEQRDVPAYVAQAYCRPNHSFSSDTTFLPDDFIRTLGYWDVSLDSTQPWYSNTAGLGIDFSIYRGGADGGAVASAKPIDLEIDGDLPISRIDLNAIKVLDVLSTQKLQELVTPLEHLIEDLEESGATCTMQ